MNFRSRPHFENRQIVQYPGEGITLSGQTTFDLGNYDGYIYDSHLDFVNGVSGSTYITLPYSASTDPISGWTEHTVFKPGYFRVIPSRKITFSGNTNIIEDVYQPDVTSYVLGSLDSQGTVGWIPMSAATVTPYIFDTSVVSDAIIPLVGTNTSQSTRSVVLGGVNNQIKINSEGSSITSGSGNTIDGVYGFIGSGKGNKIELNNSVIGGGKYNNISSYYSNIVGGHTNTVSGQYGSIVGGNSNTTKSILSFIGGGRNNYINSSSDYANIIGGSTNIINGGEASIIGGGVENTIESSGAVFIGGGLQNTITGVTYSTILGGQQNTNVNNNSHIIGSDITTDSDDTTFINNLTLRGDSIIQSTNLDSGTLRLLDYFGIVSHSDISPNIVHGLINTTYSGSSIFFLGDLTTNSQGILGYYNTGFTRPVTSITGVNFYKRKLVLKSSESDGIVINPSAMSDDKTLWFEFNGISRTQLHSSDGFFGLALNPDGSEHPTSNLQIGGTGTTGTFMYKDGNQQSGYVLTSDNDGNATWQLISTSFTGNTSGNCITDLYVSNVYGCSPITFHDTIITPDLWVDNDVIVVGSVSATTYYGDGSNLTGIITTTTATTQNILVGENVVYGDLLYLSSNGTYLKVSNTSESTSSTELRLSLESILSNNSGLGLINGLFITSGLTSGTTYWVGASGNITNIQPTGDGEIVRSVGTSIDETFFNFNPSTVWIELSNVTNPTITTQPAYRLTTISYTLTNTDWTVNVNTTGDTTQTLPLSTEFNKGKVFNIKNSDTTETSIVTISTTSSQLIDGLYGNGIDLTILYPQSITVQSIGDGYIII